MEKEYDVFSVGNALVDLLVTSNDKKLKELGIQKGGIIFLNEKDAKNMISSVLEDKPPMFPGGAAANVISMLTNLGSKTVYCGKVGNDFLGEEFESVLKKEGTKTCILKDETHTGTAITFMTPDKERSFAVYLGASVNIDKHEINLDMVKKSKIIHIEGYQFYDKRLRSIIIEVAKVASENDTLVSFDLSSFNLVKDNKKDVTKFIKDYVNILFANEDESFAFTGLLPDESVEKISKIVDIAIVKVGEKGSLIKTEGEFYKINGVKTEVVDTNGAGDAYAGAFLHAYLNGKSISECGNLASYISAKVVSSLGARLNVSVRKEAAKILL